MAGSTPIYGFPYPQSTDLVADYPTLGQELATDVETVISGLGSGLNIVTPTSIANSGGSASLSGGAVTFTGVNSISLNGIFSATYRNYRCMLELTSVSANTSLYLRWRASGADRTGSNYYYATWGVYSSNGSGVNTSGEGQSQASFTQSLINTSQPHNFSFDIWTPYSSTNESSFTHVSRTRSYASAYTSAYVGTAAYSVSDQNDGMTIYPASGTMTGTLRVYGYQNS